MQSRHGEGQSRCGRALLFSLLLTLHTGSAHAQGSRLRMSSCVPGQICTSSGADVASLAPLVQRHVEPYLASKAIAGATIGISWHGRRTFFGYGYADRDDTLAYGPTTIVEIGSITKVFTTALFAEAVAENKVQLKSKLNSYSHALGIPSLDRCGGSKNLQQLADFSSGMPRLPDVPQPAPNIQAYTVADFSRWLSGWRPADATDDDPARCEADSAYDYSNASVGILGLILEAVYRRPWYGLIESRITGPLGMDSTFFDVPQKEATRLAQGYAANGSASRPWPVYAWFASGVLKSDTADMLSFGEAALGNDVVNGIPAQTPAVAALEAAISSATAPVYNRTVNGSALGQGLAWEELIPTASQSPIYVKNGGTSGFSTALAINRNKDLAVFIAFPKRNADAQMIGVRLVRQIGSGD